MWGLMSGEGCEGCNGRNGWGFGCVMSGESGMRGRF